MPGSESKAHKSEFKCVWGCGICVAVCRENAVSHASEIFIIDRIACSECLLCVKMCPAGIIEEDLFA